MRPKSKVIRRVYWIASFIDVSQREKAVLLRQRGFEVSFFSDLDTFMTQVSRIRPAIVVLACHGDDDFEYRILEKLSVMSEIRSAKMVLVCKTANESLSKLASYFNFRDILPLELPVQVDLPSSSEDSGPALDPWIQRFIYATSSRPKVYKPPVHQITTSLATTIAAPARISWITPTHLGIETRLRPQLGSTLKVTGPLADWYGLPHLEVKVESTSKQKLRYHFSQGYVVSWTQPSGSASKTENLLEQFSRISRLPRPRVYVAIQDGALRHAVLKTLDGGNYEVAAALQKQALAEEPLFFTPDFVIIESTLTTKENLRLIVGMMAALQNPITMVILGPNSLGEQLKVLYPQHRLIMLNEASPETVQASLAPTMARLGATFASSKSEQSDAYDIPPSHPISQTEVLVPGVIASLHPSYLQLHLEQAVAQYALIRIIHPLFQDIVQRGVYAKVTTSRKLEEDTDRQTPLHIIDCYLADTNVNETQSLAQVIWQEISKELSRFIQTSSHQNSLLWRTSSPLSRPSDAGENAPPPLPSLPESSDVAAKELPAAPADTSPDTIESRPADRPKPPAKAKKRQYSAQSMAKDLVKIIAIVGVGSLCLWLFFQWLSAHVAPSGGVYSDQIKKIAPHLKSE